MRAIAVLVSFPIAFACAGMPARAQTDAPTASACGAVLVAELGAAEARLAAGVAARLLTDGFGCETTLAPASIEPALAALAAGGDAVVLPGAPTPALPMPEVAIGAPTFAGEERVGFYVPAWFAEANPDIRSLADAARAPERFAPRDGSAPPTLHLCPQTWSCAAEARAVAEAAGFGAGFDLVAPRSGDASTTALVEASEARRPWIGYYWTPSAAAAETPIRRLDPGALTLCDAESAACRAPFAPPPLVTLYSRALAERSPSAAAALDRWSLPAEEVHAALAWRAQTNASIEQTVDFLLARRPAIWRSVLDDAARGRFEAALAARLAQTPQ